MEKRTRHLSRSQFAETLGWIGAASLLSSYALLSLGIIKGESIVYHSLLCVGAAGLAVVTYRHRAFQSFVVNITFSILAIVAIIRLLFFT